MEGAFVLKRLIGSGDKIMLATLPVLVAGVVLQIAVPSLFDVGGPSEVLRTISIVVSVVGIALWLWSAVLILRHVPRGELITSGPFALMKHPIYTSVSLLVLPWVGFLLDSWLGALVGAALYIASRRYAPDEEAELAATFGPAWDEYQGSVKIPWL